MEKALLIAEKPDLMRKIQDAYNKHKNEFSFDIKFMAQRGHLLTLKYPDEIDPDLGWNWESLPFHPEEHGGWQYKIPEEKKTGNFQTSKDRYKEILNEYKTGGYSFIIHAGDPDQEGNILVDETIRMIRNTLPVKRFWTNDLTENAVINALKNLRDYNTEPMLVNLTIAGYCRQHSDYRFGMNLSRAATLKMGGRVSVGRVKTPILSMVCTREDEIRNFTPKTSYGVKADYKPGFQGQYYIKPADTQEKDSEDWNGDDTDSGLIYFDTEKEAEDFIAGLGRRANVLSYETRQSKQLAPKLFKLAGAQVAAGKYGFSADKTLDIIQSLYEKTWLSYPRTDCECISSHENLAKMIESVKVVPTLKSYADRVTQDDIRRVLGTKKYVNDKELEKHGHSAICPTVNKADWDLLSPDEKTIYELICRQFIAVFLPPLVQDKITLITDINGNTFKTNGHRLVSAGYSEVFKTSFTDVDIPVYKTGDIIDVSGFSIAESTTKCPVRFTTATMVAACENPQKYLTDKSLKGITKELHIGTSATRAAIIKQLIDIDHYIECDRKGFLSPSSNGYIIYTNLRDCMICRVDMTAQWEEQLEKVRQGELTMQELENGMKKTVEELILDIKNSSTMSSVAPGGKTVIGKCPECGGNILSGEKGFYCSNYKEENGGCRYGAYKIICGAKISDSEFSKLMAGGHIVKKLKKKDSKDTWEQELVYNASEHKIDFYKTADTESGIKCPVCGGNMTVRDKGLFCNDKENCKYVFWTNVCGHKFSEDECVRILAGGESGPYNFISKAGKKFKAKVRYDKKENKLNFVFD